MKHKYTGPTFKQVTTLLQVAGTKNGKISKIIDSQPRIFPNTARGVTKEGKRKA